MGFFQSIRNAMVRFMYGRNGVDQLNKALLVLYIIICFVRAFFVAVLESALLTTISDVFVNALAILILFRLFSKNLYKRRAENQRWVNWWYGVKNRQNGAKARHADKDHKYFTCKNCKAICRVPVGKGKIIITCPKCGGQINAKT